MVIKTLCVFGTRPEAIKMAPLVQALNQNKHFYNKVCVTGQHQHMLDSVLQLFNISPDFNLHVMQADQSLSDLTAKILLGMRDVFAAYKPDLVLVHGDTTTSMAAALAAYYHKIPIGHVEAGLRTGCLMLPWPEEANRKLSDALSDLYFAPTELARSNLLAEGVSPNTIYVTGNTVIDALHNTVKKLSQDTELLSKVKQRFSFLDATRRMVLITGHRRESFGAGFERICQALAIIARRHTDVDLVYPVHLNPNVQEPVRRILAGISNIYLIDPVDYVHFVYLMQSSYFILTDSGGIQEEAPSLGKPVLVLRDKTERPEALDAGTIRLVGTDIDTIVSQAEQLLIDNYCYIKMSSVKNPYGDGLSSIRIIKAVLEWSYATHAIYQEEYVD